MSLFLFAYSVCCITTNIFNVNMHSYRYVSEELRCAGVTCPALQVPSCPHGSVMTKTYTPPAGCCPSIPPQCTCDLRACHKPQCPSGQRAVPLSQASGQPGDCCDVFECQKGDYTEPHTTQSVLIGLPLGVAMAKLVRDSSPLRRQLFSSEYGFPPC